MTAIAIVFGGDLKGPCIPYHLIYSPTLTCVATSPDACMAIIIHPWRQTTAMAGLEWLGVHHGCRCLSKRYIDSRLIEQCYLLLLQWPHLSLTFPHPAHWSGDQIAGEQLFIGNTRMSKCCGDWVWPFTHLVIAETIGNRADYRLIR